MHPLSGTTSLSMSVAANDILSSGGFMVTVPQQMLMSVYIEGQEKFEVRIHRGY